MQRLRTGCLPDSTLVDRVHLASERTAVCLGELHRVRYRTDYSAHHQQHTLVRERSALATIIVARRFPSLQLGTVTLAGGKSCLSVRARVCPRYKYTNDRRRFAIYVLTVYPAESWVPRVRVVM